MLLLSVVLVPVALLSTYTHAQATDVICDPQFGWVRANNILNLCMSSPHPPTHSLQMNNTLVQNPCLVASYLRVPCSGNSASFPSFTSPLSRLQRAEPRYTTVGQGGWGLCWNKCWTSQQVLLQHGVLLCPRRMCLLPRCHRP